VAGARQSGHQHHKLTEVDLAVSVKIQAFQQLVHFALVLGLLQNQREIHIREPWLERFFVEPKMMP